MKLVMVNFKNNKIGKYLLSKFKLLDEIKPMEVSDSLYLPFYYYLGKEIKPKILLEIGFGLGLCSGSFLLSCNTVENFVAYQELTKEYYNKNIAKNNVCRYYKKKFSLVNKLSEIDIKPDLVIIREKDKEKMSQYLGFAWDLVSHDSNILIDYIDVNESVFDVFCKVRNRIPEKFKTRYGCGLIVK